MYKFFTIGVLALLASANIFAQNIVDFELTPPTAKASGNLYRSFRYIDSRPDTADLGFVQTGFFNRRGTVIAKTPLAKQLTGLFNAIADTAGKQPELIFQLWQCSFVEITAGMSEKGFFSLRAGLYSNSGGNCREIRLIDTIFVLKSAIDVTQDLLRAGRQAMSDFLTDNVTREGTGAIFSYHDVLHIDSVEKRKIMLYNTATYVDGLYLNYKSFMNQTPDKKVTLDGDDLNQATIKATGENGKPQKVKATKVYAIVYKGQPYVATRGVYYQLKKENDDFVFTGKEQVSAGNGDVIAATVMFGVLGSLLTSNTEATFEMKIDHLSGRFIRLKEIPEAAVAENH